MKVECWELMFPEIKGNVCIPSEYQRLVTRRKRLQPLFIDDVDDVLGTIFKKPITMGTLNKID